MHILFGPGGGALLSALLDQKEVSSEEDARLALSLSNLKHTHTHTTACVAQSYSALYPTVSYLLPRTIKL